MSDIVVAKDDVAALKATVAELHQKIASLEEILHKRDAHPYCRMCEGRPVFRADLHIPCTMCGRYVPCAEKE
jgi:hypothetical protein